jgi:uncharacterized protein
VSNKIVGVVSQFAFTRFPMHSLSRFLRTAGMAVASLVTVTITVAKPLPASLDIVNAARSQIGVTLQYQPAYEKMAYPNGDVPRARGVCTDVIIRALRDARGLDLQQEVHVDMAKNLLSYPKNWGAKQKLDSNIDHRRVPNLMVYFARSKLSVSGAGVRTTPTYLAGDIVAWNLGRGLQHIGIVTDKKTSTGTPLVVHNIGRGALEEDILHEYKIIGHYRFPALPAVIN